MRRHIIVLGIVLYGIALLQASVFPHLFPQGFVPFILPVITVLATFSRKFGWTEVIAVALIGGFFADAFSTHPFGIWMGIILFTALVTRGIARTYVQAPIFQKS